MVEARALFTRRCTASTLVSAFIFSSLDHLNTRKAAATCPAAIPSAKVRPLLALTHSSSCTHALATDTWFHPPARSRSHTVSGTQDDQHAVPRDTLPPTTTYADPRPSVAHTGRRASLLASAFGSLLSPTTSRSAATDDSLSTGMTTPPMESAPTNKVDHEHADELHDSVSAYTPLSRVWSLKARRSSWGPAAPTPSENSGAGQGSVVAWINSQEKETGNRGGQSEVSASAPPGTASSLFRRFSSGATRVRALSPFDSLGGCDVKHSRLPVS